LLHSSPLSCSADLILSSLFGGKKKTAVSFATRGLSVAAVEERPAKKICCCLSLRILFSSRTSALVEKEELHLRRRLEATGEKSGPR
jgi:hypothetical protein